jgi:hypothetical protein
VGFGGLKWIQDLRHMGWNEENFFNQWELKSFANFAVYQMPLWLCIYTLYFIICTKKMCLKEDFKTVTSDSLYSALNCQYKSYVYMCDFLKLEDSHVKRVATSSQYFNCY